MVDIEKYFADQLVDIAEVQEIIKALRPEFESLETNIYNVLYNMFLLDLNEDGCTRYESMLGLTVAENDTLENRRFRILAAHMGDIPYTMISLWHKLEELCGVGNVEIELDAANYEISIYIGLDSKRQYDNAYEMVKKMLPVNLVLNYSLKYNQHKTLSAFTHTQLSQYTHKQLRESRLRAIEPEGGTLGAGTLGSILLGGA